jgi:hypothetical protein
MPQQPALTTSAYALHNLGLAVGFGGSLFGKAALNPSVHVLKDHTDRGAVVNRAWNRYNVINAVGMGLTALSWFTGRSFISGRAIDKTSRRLSIAKDILLGTSIVAGASTIYAGKLLSEQAPEGRVDIDGGAEPSPRTPEKARKLQRFIDVAGNVGLAASAAVIALTAVLDLRGSRSVTWNAIAKVLP